MIFHFITILLPLYRATDARAILSRVIDNQLTSMLQHKSKTSLVT